MAELFDPAKAGGVPDNFWNTKAARAPSKADFDGMLKALWADYKLEPETAVVRGDFYAQILRNHGWTESAIAALKLDPDLLYEILT